MVIGIVAVLVVLSAAGILWTVTKRPSSPVPPPAAAVMPAPQPSPQPAAEPKPVAPPIIVKKAETPKPDAIALELTARDRTTIVFRSEGQSAETLLMKAGDFATLHAKKEAVLIVTNPAALEVKLNGKPASLGDRRRASEWVVTPDRIDESVSRLLPGNTITNRGKGGLGSPDRQKELAQSPDSVRLLIKSPSVPESLTLVVRVDNDVLFRRDSGPVGPLAAERLIPSGSHSVRVNATAGYLVAARAEITGTFDAGQQRTLLIEFTGEPQRGRGANSRLQLTLQ
jgi:hypothetical protein